MARRYGGYGGYGGVGTTGLGDVAAIGQGILGGVDYALNTGSRLQALLIAKDEEKRRQELGRQAMRLKAVELEAQHPEMADRIPGIFGDQVEMPPGAAESAQQVRDADRAVSDFYTSRNLENYQAAAAQNPWVGRRLSRNSAAVALYNRAIEEQEDQRAHAEMQDTARRLMIDNPGLTPNAALRRAAAQNPRAAMIFEKRLRHTLEPEMTPGERALADRSTPEARNAVAQAETLGRHGIGLGQVNDAVQAGPEEPQRLSLRGYFGNEPGPAVALPPPLARGPMPGRSTQDQILDALRTEAAARVSPEAKERLALDKRRVDLTARDVKTREGELERRVGKDKETKDRIGATLKTFEAMAIDTAKKAFPNDPVKQMALAEKLRDRLRSISAISGQDKDAGEIEQEIRNEIARAKGEIAKAMPEARAASDSWLQGLWNSVFGRRSAPARPAPAPSGAPPQISGNAPQPAAAAPQGFDEMPDPSRYTNKRLQDTETGTWYRSNGRQWVPE